MTDLLSSVFFSEPSVDHSEPIVHPKDLSAYLYEYNLRRQAAIRRNNSNKSQGAKKMRHNKHRQQQQQQEQQLNNRTSFVTVPSPQTPP